ncbi:hypothetical protein [Lapidilactobacillus wuchangensis]|uniref:hypothetical protein n=1 Tax=Lapidilactobacillus wuchangensis TaxID=2486001 RepID=UPI000F76FD99|nr:hypothetical protein [Lapidilactobacillus wuchangensis]
MTLHDSWKGGFTLNFSGDSMFDEEWLLDERNKEPDELHFMGYDANLYPLPNLSKIPSQHRQEVINQALSRFRKVNADVWLDDCQIKNRVKESAIDD